MQPERPDRDLADESRWMRVEVACAAGVRSWLLRGQGLGCVAPFVLSLHGQPNTSSLRQALVGIGVGGKAQL
jgi:hypothetical protein